MQTTTPQAPTSRAAILAAERANILSHYDAEQQAAVLKLYTLAQEHLGTSGGNTAAKLLLGLYNGQRFPFDLTNLRFLDAGNLEAAFTVMLMDAARTYVEVHELLNAILGVQYVGVQFEVWAFDLKLKGKCTKDNYLESQKRLAEWAAAS